MYYDKPNDLKKQPPSWPRFLLPQSTTHFLKKKRPKKTETKEPIEGIKGTDWRINALGIKLPIPMHQL